MENQGYDFLCKSRFNMVFKLGKLLLFIFIELNKKYKKIKV